MSSYWMASFALAGGVVSAKWAMDLGYSQARQVFWGIAGVIAGPLVMLTLYCRQLRRVRGPARNWF